MRRIQFNVRTGSELSQGSLPNLILIEIGKDSPWDFPVSIGDVGEMARRTGRPRWTPPNLEEVRKLAASGLTMDQIADALGISRTTLFKKKREFADFADAIKKGAAEGIIVATSKLFQMVKGRQSWGGDLLPEVAGRMARAFRWGEREH